MPQDFATLAGGRRFRRVSVLPTIFLPIPAVVVILKWHHRQTVDHGLIVERG
jgi:hypothetical protein